MRITLETGGSIDDLLDAAKQQTAVESGGSAVGQPLPEIRFLFSRRAFPTGLEDSDDQFHLGAFQRSQTGEIEIEGGRVYGAIVVHDELIGFLLEGIQNADAVSARWEAPGFVQIQVTHESRHQGDCRAICASGEEGHPCVDCRAKSGRVVRICC